MQDKNSSQALGGFFGEKYVYVLFFWVYLKWNYNNIGVVVRILLSEFPCGRPSRKYFRGKNTVDFLFPRCGQYRSHESDPNFV